ncbi:hypothetical protein [Virgibacillus necropolis]|uniref:Uncharacterized protein n=1 Tax=Virgibacillus necropolis TaxID=163877 RepID=A0A221MEM2_9BACI|nr:hypothetical protein [Virgibacillus necropolis]ASN06095.1 hypothetical protein CFK40_14245 [Virgibacillus necropolis]
MEEEGKNSESGAKESEKIPDVRAFNDEFTRSFLQSANETRPGYYPFLSGLEAYKMNFPEGGVIGDKLYSKEENGSEKFLVGVDDKHNIESSINITYLAAGDSRSLEIELHKERLSSRRGMDLKFNKISSDNKTIYIAPYTLEDNIYGYAAFVQNEVESGAIEIMYTSECMSPNCSDLESDQREKIRKWIKSITFIQKSSESE